MDVNRTAWNERQKALKTGLLAKTQPAGIIDLFFRQHAAVHASVVSNSEEFSFDDELWNDLTDEKARRITTRNEHSIVWIIWHMARCEDATMSLLVGGCPQVLTQEGWLERVRATIRDTGNSLDRAGVECFSAEVDIPALRAYRSDVGRQTREIIAYLTSDPACIPVLLRRTIDHARVQQLIAEGVVLDDTRYLTDYWGAQTVAGLLLMPATRHPFVHYNEALKVKSAR